jgi:hypothetical protein
VSAIRLQTDRADRVVPVGCTRFFILGHPHVDPIRSATGIDCRGTELSDGRLLFYGGAANSSRFALATVADDLPAVIHPNDESVRWTFPCETAGLDRLDRR